MLDPEEQLPEPEKNHFVLEGQLDFELQEAALLAASIGI